MSSTIAPLAETIKRLLTSAEPEFVPPLAIGRIPATSAVAKSTAVVVDPVPTNWLAAIIPEPVGERTVPFPTIKL